MRQLNKYALPLLLACTVSACEIQTTVVKPDNFYDVSLSADIRNKANKYKAGFVENKLEDEEVDGQLTEEEQKAQLARRFEQSVNALYVGNVHAEDNLHRVLDLVEFSTDMFKENAFSDQLAKRSIALSDFMIDYQINAALSSKENQMWDTQIEQQGEAMAEQQSAYVTLQSRYARLKRSEEALREQLADAEEQLANANPTTPEDEPQSL